MAKTKSSINEKKVKRYRDMFNRHLITEDELQKLVIKGVITQKEYELIIASENKEVEE